MNHKQLYKDLATVVLITFSRDNPARLITQGEFIQCLLRTREVFQNINAGTEWFLSSAQYQEAVAELTENFKKVIVP